MTASRPPTKEELVRAITEMLSNRLARSGVEVAVERQAVSSYFWGETEADERVARAQLDVDKQWSKYAEERARNVVAWLIAEFELARR